MMNFSNWIESANSQAAASGKQKIEEEQFVKTTVILFKVQPKR